MLVYYLVHLKVKSCSPCTQLSMSMSVAITVKVKLNHLQFEKMRIVLIDKIPHYIQKHIMTSVTVFSKIWYYLK